MPNIEYDHSEDIFYINESEEEKSKRELREQIKEKISNKKEKDLTKNDKDELLLTLAKMHGLIE